MAAIDSNLQSPYPTVSSPTFCGHLFCRNWGFDSKNLHRKHLGALQEVYVIVDVKDCSGKNGQVLRR